MKLILYRGLSVKIINYNGNVKQLQCLIHEVHVEILYPLVEYPSWEVVYIKKKKK